VETVTELATFGETMLRFSPPEGTRLEDAQDIALRTAGAESNVAITAARLGTDATWLSKLPDSPLGRRITADTQRHGVENAIRWSNEGRAGAYYIDFGGAPRGTDVIYDREGAAIKTATPEELDLDFVRTADVFYTSGITPALSDTLVGTTEAILSTAQAADTTTTFDLNYRAKLWSPETARTTCERLFSHVDWLVVAARDAAVVLNEEGDPEDVARRLVEAHDFETVVITLGDEGALAVHDDECYRQPVFEADTLDPVGTGDAFVGGFLSRRIAGDDVPGALSYGAATAALKRTISGDLAVVTPNEVAAVLEDSEGGINR
jgi:2-dehydro-3-deoxygluconokinase